MNVGFSYFLLWQASLQDTMNKQDQWLYLFTVHWAVRDIQPVSKFTILIIYFFTHEPPSERIKRKRNIKCFALSLLWVFDIDVGPGKSICWIYLILYIIESQSSPNKERPVCDYLFCFLCQ